LAAQLKMDAQAYQMPAHAGRLQRLYEELVNGDGRQQLGCSDAS